MTAAPQPAQSIVNADGSIREATTDVAERPEFADRKATKVIDGVTITGWFTEDFTLAELKTLRARERLPSLRPANTAFDGQLEVPTFVEVLALLAAENAARAARGLSAIGVYPETKHPTHFRSINLPLEDALLAGLDDARAASAEKASQPKPQETELRTARRVSSGPRRSVWTAQYKRRAWSTPWALGSRSESGAGSPSSSASPCSLR